MDVLHATRCGLDVHKSSFLLAFCCVKRDERRNTSVASAR